MSASLYIYAVPSDATPESIRKKVPLPRTSLMIESVHNCPFVDAGEIAWNEEMAGYVEDIMWYIDPFTPQPITEDLIELVRTSIYKEVLKPIDDTHPIIAFLLSHKGEQVVAIAV